MHKGKPVIIYILIMLVSLGGCRTFHVAETTAARLETDDRTNRDEDVEQMVQPYRAQLSDKMNTVLAELETDLVNAQPESSLGNHIAGIVLVQTEKYLERDIDFAVMNHRGIRVPSLSKGPLLARDAYQVMPFDNYLVAMDLKGHVIQQLMDILASYGGWPVEDMRYEIDNDKAVNITVNGQPLEPDKTYSMAIIDYLANGGDQLSLLKVFPYENSGVLLRDAIIDYWKTLDAKGEKIRAVVDGRVTISTDE